ncbi:MAG: hypothetical protein KDB07_02040, partial [Planctomycetes bacterium]|nr:hypothetical protein [Planctomycetota bacterium]
LPLNRGEPVEQIHNALRFRVKPMLLILDNFEQVAPLAAECLPIWLRDTPQVTFVATSREPLHIEGEKAFPLSPLDANDYFNGVALFFDRAREVKRDIVEDNATREAVLQIVRELDGIPLAIELAAARCKILSPQKIVERMPRRFDLLQTRRRDASARQATLRGAIDWSWDLLEPYEQLALAQCSVFRGGFFLEAAEAVIDLSAYDDAPFEIDVIEALCEKSLLQSNSRTGVDGEVRYRLLESVREYAGERMIAFDRREGSETEASFSVSALRQRHAEFYRDYCRHWGDLLNSTDAVEAYERLVLEYENVFAVDDAFHESDPTLCAAVMVCVSLPVHRTGPLVPYMERLKRARQNRGALRDALQGELNRVLAKTSMNGGDLELASEAADDAVSICNELAKESDEPKAKRKLANAYRERAIIHGHCGRLDPCREDYRICKELAEACGDKPALAAYYGSYATLLRYYDGKTMDAIECYRKASAIYRSESNLQNLAMMNVQLGVCLGQASEYDEAKEKLAEATEYYRIQNDPLGIGMTIGVLGLIELRMGNQHEAETCFAQALDLARRIGNVNSISVWNANLAEIALHREDWEAALRGFQDSEELDILHQDLHGQSISIIGIARAYIGMLDFASAESELERCAEIARSTGGKAILDNYHYMNVLCTALRIDMGEQGDPHKAVEVHIPPMMADFEGEPHIDPPERFNGWASAARIEQELSKREPADAAAHLEKARYYARKALDIDPNQRHESQHRYRLGLVGDAGRLCLALRFDANQDAGVVLLNLNPLLLHQFKQRQEVANKLRTLGLALIEQSLEVHLAGALKLKQNQPDVLLNRALVQENLMLVVGRNLPH